MLKIDFNNYSGKWKQEDQKHCLKNINLNIKSKSINAIIGTIGCGKSSLFMAILEEVPFITGEVKSNSKIAFVE